MVFGHRIVMLSVMLALSLRKLVEGMPCRVVAEGLRIGIRKANGGMTKQDIAYELFKWSRSLFDDPPEDGPTAEQALEMLERRLEFLGYEGIELCHWQAGIIGTLDEGWSCLLVTLEGDFVLKEGTRRAGCTQMVIMDSPEALARWLSLRRLREVYDGVTGGTIYDAGNRALWQPRDNEVEDGVRQLQDARERKDVEAFEHISTALEEAGIAVRDTPSGPRWRRRGTAEGAR
jgi:hypothetical protein|tara:strand:+ start:2080 stop:2775 length:696 start_codon:yes stop_codon:yes gene_type:complete